MEKILNALAVMFGTFVVGSVLAVITLSLKADGRLEYCYITYYSPQGMPPAYQLRGFRAWRDDRTIGVFPTMPEATKAAESMKCELGSRGEANAN